VDATNDSSSRAFNWLADNRLAEVLHVGDRELAYRFSEQGHEVVVLSEESRRRSDAEVSYVCGTVDHLPFIASSFDVVVCPSLHLTAIQTAGIARVLRPHGRVATVSRTYDDTIPWVRRLLTLTNADPAAADRDETVTSTGLFLDPETKEIADWVELDLPSTITFARSLAGASFGDDALAHVRELFAESAQQTGTLRLRHRTQYVRAQVDKSQLPDDDVVTDTTLFDLR